MVTETVVSSDTPSVNKAGDGTYEVTIPALRGSTVWVLGDESYRALLDDRRRFAEMLNEGRKLLLETIRKDSETVSEIERDRSWAARLILMEPRIWDFLGKSAEADSAKDMK